MKASKRTTEGLGHTVTQARGGGSLVNHELSIMTYALSLMTQELSLTTYELSLMTYELSLMITRRAFSSML